LNSREPNKVKIKSVLADGAYNSSTKFAVSYKKMIKSEIKVRKNSIISNKNNRLRKQVVMFQEKRIC
jgi:hypothetical protein